MLLVAAPALANTTSVLRQAQSELAQDATVASLTLQQAAALSNDLTVAQGASAVEAINIFAAWAADAANQSAQPVVVSRIFTSLLTLASTSAVTQISPDLYADLLVKAQQFVDSTPAEELRMAELPGFLQMALGVPTPPNAPALPPPPSAD